MRPSLPLWLLAAALALASPALAAPPSPNLVEVQTATFLGGPGTEWFTAGAFPGDDSILVGGITLDPDLSLCGVKAEVLGTDAPGLPAPKAFVRLGMKDTGKIAVPDIQEQDIGLGDNGGGLGLTLEEGPSEDELKRRAKAEQARLASVPRRFQFYLPESVEEKEAWARLAGTEPSATGFLARFDATLQTVRTLVRLPRGAGTISSIAIGSRGEVYIAGAATERIDHLSPNRRKEALPQIPAPSERDFPFRHVYLARLAPDLSKALWVRDIEAASYAPTLRALQDGNVAMLGPSYFLYNPNGELVQATFVKKQRVASGSAVCPVTGRFTRVGDWMSPTGREPYRCPRLIVCRPDGSVYKYLQGWRGPFFCPNHFHLVADSAVRRSAYDTEGNLYYSTWSHGGNNSMGRLPYDPERFVPNAMFTVGSSTYCFIVKLGPEHNVKTATLWTSAGSVHTLAVACDGSVVWAGRGNVRPDLPNTLAAEDGTLLVVTEPNLGSYRFLSAMPAVGTRVAVGGCDDKINAWAFASGSCAGRPTLLCLSGAIAREKTPEGEVRPPLRAPVQDTFAGGLMDGYAVLMDLTAKQPLAFDPPVREKKPRPVRPYEGPRRLWPTEGQVWKIGTESCTTVKVTFRDEHDAMWPSFFMGRGVAGGTFTYGLESAAADFTLDCPTILQQEGLQHQRVLGELVTAAQATPDPRAAMPTVKVRVTRMSPWEETAEAYGLRKFPIATCTISGTLELSGRSVPFADAPCRASFAYPYRKTELVYPAPNYALPSATFTVPGEALGLKPPLAGQQVRVRVSWEAVSDVTPTKADDGLPPPPAEPGMGEPADPEIDLAEELGL